MSDEETKVEGEETTPEVEKTEEATTPEVVASPEVAA